MTTVSQIADRYKVSVSNIKRFLRDHGFASRDRTFAGGDASLTHEEIRAIDAAAQRGELFSARARKTQDKKSEHAPEQLISSDDIDALEQCVVPAELDLRPEGSAAYPVFAHQDVLEYLADPRCSKVIKKLLTRRVQELMAHGRATRTKGVKGPNAGYLRVPLGGKSGMQSYLWLVNRGDRIRSQDTASLYEGLPSNARLLRAVRHHDDTTKKALLRLGGLEDYAELATTNVMGAATSDGLDDPLLPAQQRIVSDESPIRLIQGQPGAGKTTTLLASVRRLTGRMLYLTWSDELAERAREWLRVSAPPELEVSVWTFRELVRRIDPTREPARRTAHPERIAALAEHLAKKRAQLGAWASDGELRAAELYAELHAHVFGAALPVGFRERRSSTTGSLTERDYVALRTVLGKKAAKAAFRASESLANDADQLFPAPRSAFAASYGLQSGAIVLDPEVFGFEWVLIDEVQDLTLVEQWLVVDVTARVGSIVGRRPGLIIAGDEAQTVRPTAFEWGPLADLVTARFGRHAAHRSHELTDNLRSPHDIAVFLNRLRRRLYGKLDKRQRPRGRIEPTSTDVTPATILLVEADVETSSSLFSLFGAKHADTALVCVDSLVPERVANPAAAANVVVWTSEQVKGLEFRIVCVLDVAEQLDEIAKLATLADEEPVYGELARSSIDRLLVAMSRTTEMLILHARRWDHDARTTLAAVLQPEGDDDDERIEDFMDLVSHEHLEQVLELDGGDRQERIEQLLVQSRRQIESGTLINAIQLARLAEGQLGRSGRPGSAGEELRAQVRRHLGIVWAQQALDRRSVEDVQGAAAKLRLAGRRDIADLLTEIGRALRGEVASLQALRALRDVVAKLESALQQEPSLRSDVVHVVRERLEAAGATMPRSPQGRQALLALTELARRHPDLPDVHESTVLRVLRTISTDAKAADEFAVIREQILDHPELPVLDARHAEATGDVEAATALWIQAGKHDEAMRCVRLRRELGATAQVAAQLDTADRQVLEWAARVDELLAKRPVGELHPDDAALLRAAIKRVKSNL